MDENHHIDPRLLGSTEALYQGTIAEASRTNIAKFESDAHHQSHGFPTGSESNYFKSAQW